MKKCNFTLIELLTVIIIIGVLIGLIMAALTGGREQARRTEARIQAEALRGAIGQYESDYGMLPSDETDSEITIGGSDENSSDPDYEALIEKLAGENPRNIRYISVDQNSKYLDPWDQEYVVVLDTDYSGDITVNYNGQTVTLNRSAAVWSRGNPDRDHGPVLPWD